MLLLIALTSEYSRVFSVYGLGIDCSTYCPISIVYCFRWYCWVGRCASRVCFLGSSMAAAALGLCVRTTTVLLIASYYSYYYKYYFNYYNCTNATGLNKRSGMRHSNTVSRLLILVWDIPPVLSIDSIIVRGVFKRVVAISRLNVRWEPHATWFLTSCRDLLVSVDT